MEWQIGNVKIKNQVVLAPMAGISNSAFRTIAKDFGCGLIYTEMVSDKAITYENKKTIDMLYMTDYERPIVQQIFGSDEKSFVEAAKYIYEHMHPDIIDINMGCPVPKAGAKAICIHPRNRSQGYSGTADWSIIKQVKEAVNIPVIGNGDIKTAEDAKRMIEETNCDAVMIARGVLGNPWLIKDIINILDNKEKQKPPTPREKIDVCLKHLNLLAQTKSEKIARLEIRNHIAWYLKGLKNSNETKNKIYKCPDISGIILLLNSYKEELNNDKEN